MIKTMLTRINRRVKQLEKHLDIKIVYQGEEVDTVFERFFSFSFECAAVTIFSSEKSKRYKLHYDFNNGSLTDLEDGLEVEVIDLFSSRHLRSILYIAHETMFLNATENLSDFTMKIHRDFPTPIFCTQIGSEKKWFMIESIDVVNDSKIYMDGLFSIDDTYTHQPTKAKCVFDIKRKCFSWEYTVKGRKKKEVEDEHYYSWYKIKMRDLLYSLTELRIDNPECKDQTPAMQCMVNDMLKVFKKQKIHIFSKKRAGWGNLKAEYICCVFWNIKSVSNEEIVLLACDGNTLSKEVVFNRTDRRIYAPMPRLGRNKMQEMEFPINSNKEKEKFFKVIRSIEKKQPI